MVDEWLAGAPSEPTAVWGLGQSFVLLCAYSKLGQWSLAAGVDDNPARFDPEQLGFPVTTLEGALELGARRILLTFNPGPSVVERLERAGVDCHGALSTSRGV